MKKYIILLFLWSTTLVSRGQSPGGVTGVSQWYKNTGATATQWTDATSNNNHVPVSTAAPTTTSSIVNFNPMVTFNGSTQRYRRTTAMTNAPTNTSGATYFYIAKTGNTADAAVREVFGRGGWYYTDGISSGRYGSQLHAGSYYAGYTQDARIDGTWIANELKLVRCGYSSGASNTLYISQNGGNEVVAGAASTKTFNNDFAIGIVGPDNATYAWSGDIGEVIAFPSKLSATDYKKVESYLAIKYGMTLNQSTANNYLNSSGGVVWNATTNAGFNNNIAGIARDSATDLNQKQSRSINNSLTPLLISTIGAANSNALNTTSLSNNQYLIWGDNGLARSMSVSLSGSTAVNTRFAAVWKVQNTNNVGTVRVMWPSGISNLNLIQSNDATFDGSDVVTPMTNTMVINGTTFNYADVTIANGQFITFGTYIIAPGGVTAGLVAWYKADFGTNTTTNGANVNSWTNLMGGAATTPAGYTSPTFLSNFHNYNPTINIATEGFGIGLIQNNLFPNTAERPLTMYTVGSRPVFTSGNTITWSGFNDGTNGYEGPWIGSYLSNFYYYNINGNGTLDIGSLGMSSFSSNYPYINGLTQLSGAAMATSGTNFIKNGRTVPYNGNTAGTRTVKPNYHIFWDWNTTALGKIPESIVYDRVLTAIERNRVESYLAIKYGISLKSNSDNSTNGLASRDYVNSSNQTIWNVSGHTYNHNVFGIARDEVSLLNQRISRSENFRIGNSVILQAASTNNFTLPNNDVSRSNLTGDLFFTLFGDNNITNTALDAVPVTCPALSDGMMQIKRKWRVQETGSVVPIFIEVDLSSYTLSSDIQLWVGDNEALTSNSYIISALSIVGGKAVFQVDFKDSAVQFFTVVGKVGAPACQVCRGGKYIVRQGNSWNTTAKKQNDSTGWFTYGTDGEGTSLQARNIVAHTTPSNEWVDVWYPAPYGSSALIPHVGTTNGAASKRVYTTVLNRAGKVNFSMAGISEYYGNKVKVIVKGFCGAGQVNPIITPMVNSVWNGYTISGNTVTGSKYYREIDVYSQVKVSFNSPVERVEVEYTIERNPVYYTHFWFTLGDMSVECESPIEPNKNNVYIKQSFENDNIAACNEAELKLNIMNKNCNNRVLSFIKNDLPSGLEYVPNSYTGPGTSIYSGQSFLLENLNMSSGDTNLFVKVRATNPDAIVSSTDFNTQSQYVVSIASGGIGDTVLSDNLSILTGLQATTLTLTPKIPTVMPEMEFTSNNGQDACDTIGYTITIINNTGATRSGLQLQPFLNLGQILNGSVTLSSGLTGAVIPNPQNNETTFFIPSLSVPVGTHTITFSTVATKIDEFAKNRIELFYDPTSNECALANKNVANLNRKCPTCEEGKGLFKMNNAWNNGGETARNSNQILNITVGNPGSGVIKAEAVVTYPLSGGQSIEWYPTFFPRMNGKWTEISRNDNLNGAAGKVFYEVKLKDNGGSLIAARPSFQVAGMTKISGQEDIVSIKGYCGLDEVKPKLRYAYNSIPSYNAYYRRFVIDSANATGKGTAPYYDDTDWATMNVEFEKPVDRFMIEWSVNRSPIYTTQSNLYIGNIDFLCDNKPEPNPDDVHILSSIVGADTLPHCQEGNIKLNIKNWNCDPRTINLTSTLPAGIQFVDSSYNGIGSEAPAMSGQSFSLSNLTVPSGNSYLYMKVKSINNTTASYATNFKYTVQGGTNNPNPYQSDDNSSLEGFQDLVINFESSPIIEKPTLVLKTDKECYEQGDTILYTMIFNNSSSSSLTNVEIIERMDNVKFLTRVNATTFGGTILSEDSLGFYISDAVIPVGKDSIVYKAVVLDTVKYIENLFEISIDPQSPCGNVNKTMSNLHRIDTAYYYPGLTTGTPKTSNVGITTLNIHKPTPWPSGINNAWLALESRTKGFVITRTSSASIPTPIEGMLIYDTTDKCFKLYSETIWKCITRQCKEN